MFCAVDYTSTLIQGIYNYILTFHSNSNGFSKYLSCYENYKLKNKYQIVNEFKIWRFQNLTFLVIQNKNNL